MSTNSNQVLGKYEILEQIGAGGFASVYRALDTELERKVALKLLAQHLYFDAAWMQRFRKEARVMARLRHRQIVTVFDVGEVGESSFIAMELVEGGNLGDHILKTGQLSWEEVTRLLGEMADALDYAHSQGVLHRDLKPANVLLDGDVGAMLSDFGLASLFAEHSLSVSLSDGVVGTPAYIAPEIWEGEKATPATDIYALGCILYEMVMGETLFAGETPPATMRSHFQPRKFPSQWPSGTPNLTQVLETALAHAPSERYTSAGELARAVMTLSEDTLAEPYADLEAALAADDWQNALGLAKQIRSKNPDYRDVVALQQRALAGLEQEARAEQAANWKVEAKRAISEEDWDGAERALIQWLQLTPDDERAQSMQEEIAKGRAGVSEDSEDEQPFIPGDESDEDDEPDGDTGPTTESAKQTEENHPGEDTGVPPAGDEVNVIANTQQIRSDSFWRDLGIIVLGWAIGMAISRLFLYLLSIDGRGIRWGEFGIFGAVPGAIGWAIGGYVMIKIMKRYFAGFESREVVFIVVGWAIGGAIGWAGSGPLAIFTGEPHAGSTGWAVGGAIGGIVMAITLRRHLAGYELTQSMLTISIWVLGWVIGGVIAWVINWFINIVFYQPYFSRLVVGAIAGAAGGAFAGAIGGFTMLRQIRLAQESKEQK